MNMLIQCVQAGLRSTSAREEKRKTYWLSRPLNIMHVGSLKSLGGDEKSCAVLDSNLHCPDCSSGHGSSMLSTQPASSKTGIERRVKQRRLHLLQHVEEKIRQSAKNTGGYAGTVTN